MELSVPYFYYLPSRVQFWLKSEPDCFFIVGPEGGETERIGAIKMLMMGDSVPIRNMLQDSLLAEQDDIRITDVEPKTFSTYIACCYGGMDCLVDKLNFEDLVKLLCVTDKYLADEITNKIVIRLKKLFCLSNFFIAISYSVCFSYLSSEISEVLTFNFKNLVKDTRFLELEDTAIDWLFQQNSYAVKEIDLWNGLLNWAKFKTKSTDRDILRSCLFNFLKHIRFLTMEYTDFWVNVVSCEILTDEEVKDICKALTSGEPCTIDHLNQDTCNRYNLAQISEDIISTFIGYPRNAFINCTIKGIESLVGPWTDHKNSKTYHWADHLWAVSVRKVKWNNAAISSKKRYALSVFVGCRGQSSTGNCSVDIEISLINQGGLSDFSEKTSYTYTYSDRSEGVFYGFPTFKDWYALNDPESGFVRENTVILIVQIKLSKETVGLNQFI